jgi:Tol biopolymer transport system component
VKPANVKLGADGSVKILDFGLARAYEGDSGGDEGSATSPTMTAAMTNAGVIMGTAAYMSPEQARGKTLDKRTDIFSFGVVLYEMLTGHRPFEGETLSDTLASVLKEHADEKALPDDTPPALRMVLDRCLEKDGKKRLRDIGEARLIIEAVKGGDLTASSVLGKIPSAEEISTGKTSGLRPREIAAWALAAITVIFMATQLIPGKDSPASDQSAWKLSVPLDGEVDIGYTHGGLVISPDGSRIAYLNHKKLYVRRLDSWDPIEIGESEGAANPFWSPDGKWLAFSKDREFWKVRQDGTQRTRISLVETPISYNTGGAWLADDRIAYRGEIDLLVMPAAGGKIDTLYSATADSGVVDFHQPHSITGGHGVITVVHTPAGTNTIGIITQNGVLHNVLTIPDAVLAHATYSPSGHILFHRDKDIWAVGFSLEDLVVKGEPFPVAREAAVPSVSDNGTLTFVRNAGEILRQFVLVNRAGEIVERLGQPADFWATYAMTPDGTRAAASQSNSSTDLWLYDDRMARTRITFTDIEHDMPSFSRDGRTIYFATGIESEFRIGSKSVDRNEAEKVLVSADNLGPHYYAACPTVNRDETLLFYTSIGANKKQDIAWLDLTGDQGPQPFLTGEAAEYDGRPSPADHHYVAYVSEESGTGQVYLTTWPDADQKLPVSIDGGYWPRWKEDGSELFFAIKNDIYAVDVKYDPLSLGRPVKLFSRPEFDDRQPQGWPSNFDVTADGEKFLVTELMTGEEFDPGIAIIQNWASSLEQE